MTEGIFINTVTIVVLLPLSCSVVILVNDCPSNEQLWAQKSRTFLCKDPNEVYHCIQTNTRNLIEICMRAFNISSNKVGCPWVQIIDGTPYLGHPFKPCDSQSKGCPKESHKIYSTNELYTYPSCIKPGDITITKGTTTVNNLTETASTRNGLHIGVIASILGIGTLFVIMVVWLICLWKNKKHKERYLQAKTDCEVEANGQVILNLGEQSNGGIK